MDSQQHNRSISWVRRYIPSTTGEVVGQQAAVRKLTDFIQAYPQSKGKKSRKKSVFLYGPPGSGKTSSVYAVAREQSCEVVELNASDFRNADAITTIIGAASTQLSLFGKGKIILVDEVDGVSGQKDRGGVAALAKLVADSAFPIVMTANDPWDKKFSSLRRISEMIEFGPLDTASVNALLLAICQKEGIEAQPAAILSMANRCGGDMRAAINDLQIIASSTKTITQQDVDNLSDRNRTQSLLGALLKIFKTVDFGVAALALEDVEEQPNELFLWLDENLPAEYKNPAYLARAYEALSVADLFSGRIRRSQYWRFLVYIKLLLSAGVALAKDQKSPYSGQYQQSTRPLKIWIANARYQKRKSIAAKLAEKTHTSPARAIQDTLPFLKVVFKNNTRSAQKLIEELDLNSEEVEWLSR